MIRKFASLEHSATHGYAYDSEAWSGNAPVATHFRMYQTYGDGLCQHSGDWAVTAEYFGDYMLSLAAAMLVDSELCETLCHSVERKPSDEAIAFCAGIVFKPVEGRTWSEAKTRYYSMVERKVSTAPAKEHDKRYEKVEQWNDGQPAAILRMLLPEYAGGLERFGYASAIRQWCFADSKGRPYMELTGRFIGWTADSDTARNMQHGYDAAGEVAQAYRLRASAQSTIDCVTRNLARRAELKAAETVEAAA